MTTNQKTVNAIYKKNTFITILLNNKPYTILSSEPIFNDVVSAWKSQDVELLNDLVNRPKLIEKYSEGNIKVFDGVITYKNTPVKNYMVDKIFEFMEDGLDFMPLVRFLDSLLANPSKEVQDDLYFFLEANQMAITEDGGFLAYKLVKDNGSPYYQSSSDMVYRLGETYEMKREDVSQTREECFGAGLYFGNKGYWNNSFDDQNRYTGDGKMFIVKLMPEWVVSIPSKEAQTKGRAYKMQVIAEYESVREVVNNNKVVEIFDENDYTDGVEDQEYVNEEFDYSNDDKEEYDIKVDFSKGGAMSQKTKVFTIKPKSPTSLRRDKFGRFVKKTAPRRDSRGRFIRK